MGWLPEEEQEEWNQDPLVEKFRERWEGKKKAAVARLMAVALAAPLEEVRRASQRVADIEEFLLDLNQESNE